MKQFILIVLMASFAGAGYAAKSIPPNDTALNNQNPNYNNPAINMQGWKDSTVMNSNTGSTVTGTKSSMKAQSYYLQNGKLYQYSTSGKLNEIDKTVTFKNGTTLSPEGIVKMKNGKPVQLQTNEGIDMNGTIAPYKP